MEKDKKNKEEEVIVELSSSILNITERYAMECIALAKIKKACEELEKICNGRDLKACT